MTGEVTVALIIAIGSFLTAIIGAYFTFRGGLPAAANQVAQAFKELAERQDEEIAKLRKERALDISRISLLEEHGKQCEEKVALQTEQIKDLLLGIQKLLRQLRDQDIKPVWVPKLNVDDL